MATYIYTPDSDVFDSLAFPKSKDFDKLQEFVGPSLASTWKPLSVRIEKNGKKGDFPSLSGHVPVFSKRAFDVLAPLVGDQLEALPLKANGEEELFAINVREVLPCLDTEKAEFKRFPSGGIMYITGYAFLEGCLKGKHIFKLDEAPLYKVFISDEFKERVEEAGLKGLIFKKAE